MNDSSRQKLCELIAEHGTALCEEPGRCEGYLRDLCPQHRGEVNVLINALKERVAVDLLNSSEDVPIELVLGRLSKRLEEHLGMKRQTARWAVESWALALGKISEKDIRPAPAEGARLPPRSFRLGAAMIALALVAGIGAGWYFFGAAEPKPTAPMRSPLLSFYQVVDEPTPFTLELPSASHPGQALNLNKNKSLIAPYVVNAFAVQAAGEWRVSVELAPPSANDFQQLTQDCIGKEIAIVVDGAIVSAPVVRSALGGSFEISGSLTETGARELARKLKPN